MYKRINNWYNVFRDRDEGKAPTETKLLVCQEFIIRQIHMAGKPENTLMKTDDSHVAILEIPTSNFTLTLDRHINVHNIPVHQICFDEEVVDIANMSQLIRIKSNIFKKLSAAGHQSEFIEKVLQSLTRVLFDDLLLMQQEKYLKELVEEF